MIIPVPEERPERVRNFKADDKVAGLPLSTREHFWSTIVDYAARFDSCAELEQLQLGNTDVSDT